MVQISPSVSISVGTGTAGSARTTVSEKQTTGSITAGSDILTVADGSGLSVGDWVIVETGGEAGLGARGTRGVGGTWPALSYPNATAMNADTSQPDNRACWLEDSGDVYHYDTATTTWTAVPSSEYYYAKAIPRALSAQITARVGNKIKLDRNATASTTGANVYFDNWGILQDMAAASLTVNIPAGTYHTSCHLFITGRAGITISGAGQTSTILKTPKGAAHGGISIHSSDNAVVENLQIDCNFRNAHYGMRWNNSRVSDLTSFELWPETYRTSGGFGQAVYFNGSDNSEVRDCRIVNPAQGAIVAQFLSDTWARRCTVHVDDPYRIYLQWMIQFPDVTGGGAEDCHVGSDWLLPGFEPFKSRNVTFRRCSGRNTVLASNSSDGWLFEDLDIVIEEGSKGLSYFDVVNGAPLFNINVNASGGFSTNTGQIVNPNIVQQGYADTGSPYRLLTFVVNSGACPVEIAGTYDTDPTTPKGLIDVQPAASGADSFEGLGIRSAGTLTVEGIRIKGSPPTGKTSMVHTEGGTLNITNSIFDASTPTGTATITASGNQTNAEYEA